MNIDAELATLHVIVQVDEEVHRCLCGWVHVGTFGAGLVAVMEHYVEVGLVSRDWQRTL